LAAIAAIFPKSGGTPGTGGMFLSIASSPTFYQESLDLYRQLGEKGGIALLTSRLAGISSIQGDHAQAAALYDESLRLHRELGDRRGISQDLEGIAAMLAARGQTEAAVRLWAAVEALREKIGAQPNDIERARYEPLVATTRQALGEETFADLWAEGRNLTPEQVLDAW
jgi:tetratricopeptide (TPR) repeat protein